MVDDDDVEGGDNGENVRWGWRWENAVLGESSGIEGIIIGRGGWKVEEGLVFFAYLFKKVKGESKEVDAPGSLLLWQLYARFGEVWGISVKRVSDGYGEW
jgi:hypothetical protein